MSTIAENLQGLYDIKENIKTAIESKGVAVGDARFSEYSAKIQEITVGGGDCEGVYQDGYNNGYSQGNAEGYNNGYNNGFNEGFSEGSNVDCSNVWDEAFNQGKTEGKAEGRSEVINNTVSLKITENGKYTATDEKFYKEVVVNVTAEGDGGSYNEGYNNGYNTGYGEGYREGISEGDGTFDEGYTSGYADGVAVNNGGSVKIKPDRKNLFSDLEFDTIFSIECSNITSLTECFKNSTFPNEGGIVLKNTENVTHMISMYNNTNIKKPLYFNTENVVSMDFAFAYCTQLQEIPQYITNKVNSYMYLFYGCSSLITVPQLYCGNLKTANPMPSPIYYMFRGCSSLTNLGGFVGLTYDLDLSASDLITRESMLNVFNTIGIVEGKTIDISQAVYDRLTSDDMQIATNKGWTINVK